MKALWLTKSSLLWYVLTPASLVLAVCGLIALIRCIGSRHGRKPVLLSGFAAAAAFLLFLVMMDCARYAYLSEPDPRYRPFQLALFELPWALYAALEAACALLLAGILRGDFRFRRSCLTPDAVRETVNLLPDGICVSAPDGTVLLSNLQMNTLCRTLTGSGLSDAVRFRQHAEFAGEEQNGEVLLKTPDGKTWRFTAGKLTERGETYDLLTAADVTEQYRITEELKAKNEHLQELQRRMKAVTDLSGEMFTAAEQAGARAALHNQLGQVLLMGRHALEHPESTDEGLVRMATREMNRFLLREAELPQAEPSGAGPDLLRQTLAMAKSIGVQADIQGSLPEDPARRMLLARAIQECAANAVKHAEGDRLDIRLEENEENLLIRISNNGKPPRGPVTESGGLLSLRRSAEEAKGSMTVESTPAFALILRLPARP